MFFFFLGELFPFNQSQQGLLYVTVFYKLVGGSKGGKTPGTCNHPQGPNSFNFMQFLEKIG